MIHSFPVGAYAEKVPNPHHARGVAGGVKFVHEFERNVGALNRATLGRQSNFGSGLPQPLSKGCKDLFSNSKPP